MKNKKTIAIATAAMSVATAVVPAFASEKFINQHIIVDVKLANSDKEGSALEFDKLAEAKKNLKTLWEKTYHPGENGVETKRYIFRDEMGHDLNELKAEDIEKHLLECQNDKGSLTLYISDKMNVTESVVYTFKGVATAVTPIAPIIKEAHIDYRTTNAKSKIEELKKAIKENNLEAKVTITMADTANQTGTYIVKLFQKDGYKFQVAEIMITHAPLLGNGVGEVVVIPEDNDFKNHWAKEYITDAMIDKWVVADSKFRPNDSITRAEFVRIINNAYGFDEGDVSTKPKDTFRFQDVKQDAWYYQDIIKALEAGYISGYETVTTDAQGNKVVTREFKPNAPITRQEAASIIGRLNGIVETKDIVTKFKDDADIAVWADESVAILNENKVINGYSDNTFRPKNNITRAESVVMISASLKMDTTMPIK